MPLAVFDGEDHDRRVTVPRKPKPRPICP